MGREMAVRHRDRSQRKVGVSAYESKYRRCTKAVRLQAID